MFRAKVTWSPVELEYLKLHQKDMVRDQLCIALGKTRSALDKKIKEINGGVVDSKKSVAFQSKVGLREDLGVFVRSGWEANVLRVFNMKESGYKDPEYEPQLFSFTDKVPPKGMALSYTPDFRVSKGNKKYWVEVKGNWLRGHDKTKLRRFKKYFPEEFKKLIAIVSTKSSKTARFFIDDLGVPEDQVIEYNQLKKQYSKLIPKWES